MASIKKHICKGGKVTFQVRIRRKGQKPACAAFERKTDAQKWINSTEAAIQEGRYFKTLESKRHTMGDLIDRYVEQILPMKPKEAKKRVRHLKWWKEQIGYAILADVTPSLIGEQRDKLLYAKTRRGTQRNPSTVVRYMSAISHVFTIAVKEWQWMDDNPMRKVMKPKEQRGRDRFLSEDERKILLTVCKAHKNQFLYPIVLLALSTGMRQGEILNLRWRDVDLKEGRITLRETKNGDIRVVGLMGEAYQEILKLSKIQHLHTDLLFPATRPTGVVDEPNQYQPIFFRKAWYQALETSRIKDFRFHDLRHSAASYLAMSGATPSEIAEILGHKTLSMVKRYAHLSEIHSFKVQARMNEKFLGSA